MRRRKDPNPGRKNVLLAVAGHDAGAGDVAGRRLAGPLSCPRQGGSIARETRVSAGLRKAVSAAPGLGGRVVVRELAAGRCPSPIQNLRIVPEPALERRERGAPLRADIARKPGIAGAGDDPTPRVGH